MSCDTNLSCSDSKRRTKLLNAAPPANGITDVEVVPYPFHDPLFEHELCVYFFRTPPAGLDTQLTAFSFTGGERIPGVGIHVQKITVAGTQLVLRLNQGGDFSDYTLHISHPDLDPLFNCYSFNFKVDCPRLADCEAPAPSPPPLPPDPPIDYLCKDYDSFRQALLDFLPTRVPSFSESNEGDIAVTLAELFSYAGDQLSYYQDAVSNEAWLPTARQRISAKRHARLVDYRMHDGLAARAVLFFNVTQTTTIPLSWPVSTNDTETSRRIIFETDESIRCYAENSSILPYSWLGTDCCLPLHGTQADLAGNLTHLAAGQLLLIEEIQGPVPQGDGTILWSPEAADPGHRQIVRLTSVTFMTDPLVTGPTQEVTRVQWQAADALTWPACIMAGGTPVVVFRGNLVRASQGQTIPNETLDLTSRTLTQGPLTWLYNAGQSAPPWTWLFPPDAIDPRHAVSSVRLTVNGQPWMEEESLLSSQANDPNFVVDTDNDGRGVLRFGDGELGRQLPQNPTVVATYRVGNGTSGNVGCDTLIQPIAALPAGATEVRNPLPAFGGTDPETLDDVRRDAPQAFANVLYRAVTALDYADAAKLVLGVSNAVATFRWTGSWITVFVAIDPVDRVGLPQTLRDAVAKQLESYRQAGYDLDIRPPDYVPLGVDLTICIEAGYFQSDVIGAVRQVLTSGLQPDGTPGFFHPDHFTFGQSLYLSALYQAVQNVPGVKAVHATAFHPLLQAASDDLENGEIVPGPFQVLRLDDDASRPENGILNLTPEGGQ